MRQLAFAAAFGIAALAVPEAVAAQDALTAADVSPESMTAARAIVAAMYPPETREDTLVEMAQSLGAQFSNAGAIDEIEDEGAKALIHAAIAQGLRDLRPIMAKHIPSIMEATAVSYADTFTLGELLAIQNFAATPAGSAFFEQSPNIVSHPAIISANAPYLEEIQKFSLDLRQRMLTELQDYFIQQSESAVEPT